MVLKIRNIFVDGVNVFPNEGKLYVTKTGIPIPLDIDIENTGATAEEVTIGFTLMANDIEYLGTRARPTHFTATIPPTAPGYASRTGTYFTGPWDAPSGATCWLIVKLYSGSVLLSADPPQENKLDRVPSDQIGGWLDIGSFTHELANARVFIPITRLDGCTLKDSEIQAMCNRSIGGISKAMSLALHKEVVAQKYIPEQGGWVIMLRTTPGFSSHPGYEPVTFATVVTAIAAVAVLYATYKLSVGIYKWFNVTPDPATPSGKSAPVPGPSLQDPNTVAAVDAGIRSTNPGITNEQLIAMRNAIIAGLAQVPTGRYPDTPGTPGHNSNDQTDSIFPWSSADIKAGIKGAMEIGVVVVGGLLAVSALGAVRGLTSGSRKSTG